MVGMKSNRQKTCGSNHVTGNVFWPSPRDLQCFVTSSGYSLIVTIFKFGESPKIDPHEQVFWVLRLEFEWWLWISPWAKTWRGRFDVRKMFESLRYCFYFWPEGRNCATLKGRIVFVGAGCVKEWRLVSRVWSRQLGIEDALVNITFLLTRRRIVNVELKIGGMVWFGLVTHPLLISDIQEPVKTIYIPMISYPWVVFFSLYSSWIKPDAVLA